MKAGFLEDRDPPSKDTMTPTSRRLLATLKGTVNTPPPFWFMRQAGRYLPEYREVRADAGSFLDLCYSPALACEVTLQPLRRYGMDGAILFSDILVVPDGLGRAVTFVTGEGPKVEPLGPEHPIPVLDERAFLAKLAPVYQAVGLIREQAPSETTLLGFAGAPWTVATYMIEGGSSRDFARTKDWAFSQPESFGRLIDVLVDATVVHLTAQIRAGADAVQLFDSWAGVLPESAFERWVVGPATEITRRLKTVFPEVPVIGFPRGAGALYPSYAVATGVDAISLDTTVPLHWAAEALPADCVIQGNLDPRLVVVGGDAMLAETARILETFSGRPFVFNLGHGFVPETPPENVALLARTIRDFQA